MLSRTSWLTLMTVFCLILFSCGEADPHAQQRSREDRIYLEQELNRFRSEIKEEIVANQIHLVVQALGAYVFQKEKELIKALVKEELTQELMQQCREEAARECWSICSHHH